MFKTRFISMLVLLAAVATGARAAWTGGTYTATANENLGAITVNGDATLTINSDVTVTVTGGINVASGKTLTITGPGTLVVTGAKGTDGNSDFDGGPGGTGGVAISGNIIVQGGATVTATGGTGGTGGNGEWDGGTGGNGGVAFAGTLTYKSGTVTANGGSAGSGGWSDDEERYASSGSAGKAFANDVDFTQTTGYSVTNGTSTIGSVLNQTKVVISGGTPKPATVAVTGVTLAPTSATLTLGETETVTLIPTVLPAEATDKSVTWSSSNEAVATVTDGVVTAVAAGTATITVTTTDGAKTATCAVTVAAPAPSTYTVTLKEGTEDATSWTIAPAEATTTGVEAGTEVTATYSGMKKVKSVKAKKKAAAAPALNLTSPSVGQVIGSDGKNYAAAATLPTGVTKVAMIAYVSGSNGLAIALADEGKLNWATAKSTCEAKTPAFTGGTWHLPSQAEWNQMFKANGGDEERCYGLNTKINTAGGTALLEGGTGYWTSTSNGSNVWYVWLMDGDTDWRSGNVNLAKQVRACLAF